MKNDPYNGAQTPRETEQALDETAKKLEAMDRAEGDFGEAMAEALPDEYMEEVAGGFPQVIPTSGGGFTCYICGKSVDPDKTYGACPNGQSNEKCPYYAEKGGRT